MIGLLRALPISTWIAGAAALALGAALALQSMRLTWAQLEVAEWQSDYAELQAQHSQMVATAEREARERSEANRETERLLRSHAARIEDEHRQEIAAHAAAVASFAAVNDRLRDDIDAYARGASRSGQPPSPACDERAVRLGQLLERSLRVQESLAARGEVDAAIARTVRAERATLSCAPTTKEPS